MCLGDIEEYKMVKKGFHAIFNSKYRRGKIKKSFSTFKRRTTKDFRLLYVRRNFLIK